MLTYLNSICWPSAAKDCPHVPRARLRHLAVNDLEFSPRLRNLRHLHWCYCGDWSYCGARRYHESTLPLNFRPPTPEKTSETSTMWAFPEPTWPHNIRQLAALMSGRSADHTS